MTYLLKQSEEFLGEYPTRIADVARAACHCVRECSPDAEEKVARGWKVITFGHGKPFCAVAPHKKWVNLQFHAGAELPDPAGLLVGTGRSMRHIKLHRAGDISDEVIALVQASVLLAKHRSGRAGRAASAVSRRGN